MSFPGGSRPPKFSADSHRPHLCRPTFPSRVHAYSFQEPQLPRTVFLRGLICAQRSSKSRGQNCDNKPGANMLGKCHGGLGSLQVLIRVFLGSHQIRAPALQVRTQRDVPWPPGVLGIHAPAFSFLLSVVNVPQDRMFLEENMSFLEQLASAPTLGPQLPSGAGTPSPVLAPKPCASTGPSRSLPHWGLTLGGGGGNHIRGSEGSLRSWVNGFE